MVAPRHPTILALAFFQVCAGILEVETTLFGAFMLSLRASSEVLGLVLGAGCCTGVLGSFLGGQLTDLVGARKLFLSGVALATLGLTVEGLSTSWLTAALGFLAIQGAQTAYHPAALRLVAEAAPDHMGSALGFLNTVYSVVAIGGALLTGWLAQEAGWSAVFLAKTGLHLLALLVMVPLIPPQRHLTPPPQRQRKGQEWLSPLRSAPLRHIYAALAAGTVLSYAPSFLAYDQRLAGRPLALACFPSIYNAVWLLSNWPAGVLGDKLGCWKVVVSGYALASLAWLLFPWPRETVHLYLLYSLYCLGNSAGSYAEVLVMKHAPQGEQGRAMGLLDVFRFAGSAIGEGCGGLLWRILGAEASYILTALGMGLACILVLKASQSSKTCALFPDGGDSKSLSR
jgi:predicted MFS family arabinose efflux permease